MNTYDADPLATWKRGVAKGAKQYARRMEYLRSPKGQARLRELLSPRERAV